MFSSGAGSWAAARRIADEHGTDDLTLLFADVLGEDEDNYRFLVEAAADIFDVKLPKSWRRLDGKPKVQREWAAEWIPGLVWLSEGRTIWDVFKDNRFLGNARLANCSKFLKQQPAREWLDANCDPADTTVYVGIDWTETHRLPAIERSYQPFTAKAPLTEKPYLNRDQVLGMLRRRGIAPPRLYGMGFAHANCGGGCVRAGQGQFAVLLKQMPERFAEWERNEQELREHLGKDVSILRDRTGGTVVPLTLTAFRERAESKPEQIDLFDIGGCGCFVSEDGAA
jgi:hypothetical protein